jgi:valyl-tRNA synthetase
MDEKRYNAVMEAFVRMYEAGLIYRGNRIVNWDPKGQTTISDDEIVYEERKAKLYTFKYSKDFPISISTTRPETKVGDVAVAVHPDDKRYQDYIGNSYVVKDFCGVELNIKVIADKEVDPAFGTGALGVTPAHSAIDWEMAEKNNLPRPQVINEYAKMTVGGANLLGKKVTEAREVIIQWLQNEGLLEKEEDINQNVPTAERTGGIIEPLPKLQWFVDVNKKIISRENKSLKELMREPFDQNEIKIIPEYFTKTYFYWIDNLRDWCISRQIWFGHRIPVWYRSTSLTAGKDEIYCGVKAPDGDGWIQDTDVLDTWFSAALWPFSTMGWPENTKDLESYYPTTILETGYDILPFWVARMILMGQFILGKVPFRTVYLHGIVRDAQGRKISKSLGNNIDPIDMGAKYGTDALRFSLITGTAPGTDSKISEDKIKGYSKFSNKLWNITRYILSIEKSGELKKELINEFDSLVKDVTSDMENFRFYLASEKLYAYVWHTLADKIIEESKGKTDYGATLYYILENSIKLLHPFMPFVTEEIWSMMPNTKGRLLIVEKWPFDSAGAKPQ